MYGSSGRSCGGGGTLDEDVLMSSCSVDSEKISNRELWKWSRLNITIGLQWPPSPCQLPIDPESSDLSSDEFPGIHMKKVGILYEEGHKTKSCVMEGLGNMPRHSTFEGSGAFQSSVPWALTAVIQSKLIGNVSVSCSKSSTKKFRMWPVGKDQASLAICLMLPPKRRLPRSRNPFVTVSQKWSQGESLKSICQDTSQHQPPSLQFQVFLWQGNLKKKKPSEPKQPKHYAGKNCWQAEQRRLN